MLADNNFEYRDSKIEGVLQKKVEDAYIQHLRTLGVTVKLAQDGGKERFFQLFHWVTGDFPRRRKLVKTGFRKWQTKWEAKALEEYRKKKDRSKNRYYKPNNNYSKRK